MATASNSSAPGRDAAPELDASAASAAAAAPTAPAASAPGVGEASEGEAMAAASAAEALPARKAGAGGARADAVGADGLPKLTKEEMIEEAMNCPCIAGMKEGPCGAVFTEAYRCFLSSESDPQGMDCMEHFVAMHDCMREHPDEYDLDSDDDSFARSEKPAEDTPPANPPKPPAPDARRPDPTSVVPLPRPSAKKPVSTSPPADPPTMAPPPLPETPTAPVPPAVAAPPPQRPIAAASPREVPVVLARARALYSWVFSAQH